MSHTHIADDDNRTLPEFSLMQQIKRRFFAMRNGMLADQMRRNGLDYRVNFGLNIPQIKEIATDTLSSGLTSAEQLELANALWENINTRESRLLAPMLFPADIMSDELALKWLSEAQTTEISDHLCHSLLRKLPFASEVAKTLIHTANATDMQRYSALRLLLNLVAIGKESPLPLKDIATESLSCHMTRPVARQLLDEIEFISGSHDI
ncbi:MAG: hypothetical protein HDS68_05890 [Bacteroidales bacterium]|nr:hypothetical protein [Bacteroidales bacterium]